MQTKIIFRQGGSNIDMLSRLVPDLSEDERAKLHHSAELVREHCEGLL